MEQDPKLSQHHLMRLSVLIMALLAMSATGAYWWASQPPLIFRRAIDLPPRALQYPFRTGELYRRDASGQILTQDGHVLPISAQIVGYVDQGSLEGSSLHIAGWAADRLNGAPANGIVVFVDGVAVAWATPTVMRLDVAAALKLPNTAQSGFGAGAKITATAASSLSVHVIAFDSLGQINELGYIPSFPFKR